jgi:DNA modification methylase
MAKTAGKTTTKQKKPDKPTIRITCNAAGKVRLEEVKGIQGNLKTINRKNLEKLKGRILKHGFNVPFHVWVHNGHFYLLDGHQRTRALLELQAQGYTVPPLPYDVIEAKDLKDAKDKLLGITSQYGEFTMEGLREFTLDIEIDTDLRLPSGEIRLETLRPAEEELGDDDVPDAAPKIAKRGDVWELGPHRLKVGDATSKEDLADLMQGDAAQLYFTDPPYGVDYDDAPRGGHNGGIQGDDKKGQALEKQLLAPAFRLAAKTLVDDAAIYIWHASATRINFERALTAAGFEEHQYIIWVKPAIVMGRAHYHWQHEPCFYCGKAGCTPRWAGDRKQSTVWSVTMRTEGAAFVALAGGVALADGEGNQIFVQRDAPRGKKVRGIRVAAGETVLLSSLDNSDIWEVAPDAKKDYVHPNQKPVELSMRAIINNTEAGEVVLDSFTGSGSTLLGCQRTGRLFRGLEIDPRWVDRIIKRWCLWMFNHHLEPTVTRNGKPYEWQKFCPEL